MITKNYERLAKVDIYKLLTHAIWHCQWGSQPIERPATEADLQAAKILTDLRSMYAVERGYFNK